MRQVYNTETLCLNLYYTAQSEMCSAGVSQGEDGLLTWPQTAVGESAFSDEICPPGTPKGQVFIAIQRSSIRTNFVIG